MMTSTIPQAENNKCFIGRQSIYDAQMNVVACELLFRSHERNSASIGDQDAATSQVLTTSLMEFGLDRLTGKHPAFINMTRRFVTGELPLPEAQNQIVLEVLEDIEPDDEIVAAIKKLKRRGYRIALDDFVYSPKLKCLIELADIIKVELPAIPKADLQKHVGILRQYPCELLAEKVETLEEFDYCKQLGFDMFQGYFLSKPRVISRDRLPSNKLALVQLLAKLQDPEIEFPELEKTISADVALSFKVLKYINSSALGLRRRVESLSQAIALIGLQRIRTLVSLIMLAGVDDKPVCILSTALIRATMCAELAKKLDHTHTNSFFTVGLFSALDVLLDADITTIVDELPLNDDIQAAIVDHEGVMGAALECTLAYERNDWDNVVCMELEQDEIRDAFMQAFHAVEGDDGIAAHLQACSCTT